MDTLPGNADRPAPRRRPLVWIVAGLVLLVAGATLLGFLCLRASLAQVEGSLRLVGLTAPVRVDRDELGVVTLTASNRLDAARALGFVHAQERFFQMDLLRRTGDGTLAELFGPAARERDRQTRPFQGRRHAVAALDLLPAGERALLDAYAAGVNQGLDALSVRPPEYVLLQLTPTPWQPADTLLLNLTFGFALQDADGSLDRLQDLLTQAVGPAAARFYHPSSSAWDAALDGSVLPPPPLPTPEEFSAPPVPASPTTAGTGSPDASDPTGEIRPGSNAWVLAGRRTRSGAALVADDMHLELNLPNVWFRAVIQWTDPNGRSRRLAGLTVPGAPTLLVGSNGEIAWGFTNSQVDTTDLVDLELAADRPGQYRTPAGWLKWEVLDEPLRASDGSVETQRITNTIWGPVLPHPLDPGPRAVAWVMARPEALATRFLALEKATNVTAALDAATDSPRPVQNLVVGDRAGSIGWTLIGSLPERFGHDGTRPVSWAEGSRGWRGLLPVAARQRWVDPVEGQIWTANQRVLGSAGYLALGDGGWDLGARSRQIRDGLTRMTNAVPGDFLSLQLDDQAPFFRPWQQRLIEASTRLSPPSTGSTNAAAWDRGLRQVPTWDGQAGTNSTAFPLIARFRTEALRLLFEPVHLALNRRQPGIQLLPAQAEAVADRLLGERPQHLLNRRFATYDELLTEAARRALHHPPLASGPTWGE
jgi:penicillin amidase